MFLANNVVFVAIAFVVFLGTFYPLITDALGEKRALGPPWFDDYIVPFVLVLVLLSGHRAGDRLAALDALAAVAQPAPAGARRRRRAGARCRCSANAGSSPLSLAMFALGTFAIGIGVQELWRGMRARQAMTGEAPPAALVGVVRRNRRRYGGYIVHIGIARAVHRRRGVVGVQARARRAPAPGQSTRVGGYVFTYERATARIAQRAGELERIALGSRVRVTKDGKTVAVLRPERGYYPINAPMMGALSRYFEGNATSEIGLRAGVRRDIWIAEQPDIGALQPIIKKGDAVFARRERRPHRRPARRRSSGRRWSASSRATATARRRRSSACSSRR